MKKTITHLCKIAIVLIGISVCSLCVFWLPDQAELLVSKYPEFTHLHYPLLIGIYVATIPFFFALYQTFKLFHYIHKDIIFSELTMNALKYIKYCAVSIIMLCITGSIILSSQDAGNPVTLLLGIFIILASLFITAITAIFQMVLKRKLKELKQNWLANFSNSTWSRYLK
ncbi:DUF2975 domain-containing protein [Metabacillus malikii]|uniref:MFS family arabinose efflux permease n=1 Tax=Metabacillus malikii TaxID=1504265 RepID=A0ABT9ZC75_9BACI|nr:DUF2975 domain-containing protein [Metabacillus malikii]MDQ0229853.1 putative MFS family arabinose efflux permease [Metabacillus malikii]